MQSFECLAGELVDRSQLLTKLIHVKISQCECASAAARRSCPPQNQQTLGWQYVAACFAIEGQCMPLSYMKPIDLSSIPLKFAQKNDMQDSPITGEHSSRCVSATFKVCFFLQFRVSRRAFASPQKNSIEIRTQKHGMHDSPIIGEHSSRCVSVTLKVCFFLQFRMSTRGFASPRKKQC